MREMKISKASLLTMWWIFSIASLWLMFFSVSAVDDGQDTENHVQLYFDPNNAIQHFQGVKIISSENDDDSYAIIKKNWWLVWIETDYNFLMSGWDTDNNSIATSVRRSTILWWKDNKIEWWTNEAILWWEKNTIDTGDSNSILWWVGNELKDGNDSTIFWWSGNNIKWNNSSIIWSEWNSITGNNSVVIWNHSEVNWNNSVSMWQNSKLKWNNSFLWTDGNSSDELQRDNVFVVKWEHGMVVNKNKAHSFSQLTIWGSLIIYSGDMAPQCWNRTKWIVKVVNNGDRKCLCSCDGSWWNALHDGVMCPFLCSNTPPENADCGNARRVCGENGKKHTYTWTCKTWTVVQWEWAFFVSTEINWSNITNYINWSCQSDTWVVESCSSLLDENWCRNVQAWRCIWTVENAHPVTGSNHNPTSNTQKRAYRRSEYSNQDCAYFCNTWFVAFEWKCYKCEDWTRNENNPDVCTFNVDCEEWRSWDPTLQKCVLNAGCIDTKTNSIVNSDFIIPKLNNTITSLEDLMPTEGTNSFNLRCVDDGDYNDNYIEHTCTYKCQNGYYCHNGTCTLPSCNLGQINAHGNKQYYYVTWHAKYNQFNATPSWVSTWANETSWRFYNTYANKQGCYYWCPWEYRVKYKGYRRCLSEEEKQKLQTEYCAVNNYTYWNAQKYSNPSTENQGWTYVSPKIFAEKKSEGAKWCFWTCDSWAIVAYRQAIRTSSYNDWWIAGKKLIFSSSAKSCYKKCGEWEVLNGNGICKPCPDGQIPNPNSLQTWHFERIGKYGQNQKAPFLQRYNTTETAPERIYQEISEYRNCIIGCDPGYVLVDNNRCVKIAENGNCEWWWIDKNGNCNICLYKWQMYSEAAGTCIYKKAILKLNITNTDPQWTYTNWKKINYKVTIKNDWNLTIKNITGYTYALSGDIEREPSIGLKSIWELSPWKSTQYSLTYALTEKDFKGLSEGETWSFTIKLTVTWTVVDDYIKSLTLDPNPDTLTITIKKS